MIARSALVVFVGMALACRQDRAGGSVDGASIFANVCATCHGAEGKPPAQMVAQLGVKDLTSSELRARITPALVLEQVRRGSDNKLMPSFAGALTDEQMQAVAAYVASPAFLKQ